MRKQKNCREITPRVSRSEAGVQGLAAATAGTVLTLSLDDAFNATVKDTEFLADIDKRQFDLDPVPGEELEIAEGEVSSAMRRGTSWLLARVHDDTWVEPAPIGFYFAKLWYFEKIYPLAFTVGALRAVDSLLVRRAKR